MATLNWRQLEKKETRQDILETASTSYYIQPIEPVTMSRNRKICVASERNFYILFLHLRIYS